MNPNKFNFDTRSEEPAFVVAYREPYTDAERTARNWDFFRLCFLSFVLITGLLIVQALFGSAYVAFDKKYATPKKGVSATLATTSK